MNKVLSLLKQTLSIILIISICFVFFLIIKRFEPVQNVVISPNYSFKHASEEIDALNRIEFEDFTHQFLGNIKHSQTSKSLTGLLDTLGPGLCATDLNGDTFIDLILITGHGFVRDYGSTSWWINSDSTVKVLINSNGQAFVDKTDAWIKHNLKGNLACYLSDLDSDGDKDLILSGLGTMEVVENLQSSFELKYSLELPKDHIYTTISTTDVDADGDKDVYVSGFTKYQYWSNKFESNSGFKETSSSNFDPDLYDSIANLLLINNDNFRFSEKARDFNLDSIDTRSLDHLWLDLDFDGDNDLIVTSLGNKQTQIFENVNGAFKRSSDYPSLELNEVLSIELISKSDYKQELFISRHNKQNVFFEISKTNGLNKINRYSVHALMPNTFDFISFDDKRNHNITFLANGSFKKDPLALQRTFGQSNQLLSGSDSYASENIYSTRAAIPVDIDNDGSFEIITSNNNSHFKVYKTNTAKSYNWIGLAFSSAPKNAKLYVNDKLRNTLFTNKAFLSKYDNRFIVNMINAGDTIRIKENDIEFSIHLTDSDLNKYYIVPSDSKSLSFSDLKQKIEPAKQKLLLSKVKALENEQHLVKLVSALEDASTSKAKFCAITDVLSHFFDEEEAVINEKYITVRSLIKIFDKTPDSIKHSCILNALGKSETKVASLFLEDKILNFNPSDGVKLYHFLSALIKTKEITELEKILESNSQSTGYKVISELLILANHHRPSSTLDISSNIDRDAIGYYLKELYPVEFNKIANTYKIVTTNNHEKSRNSILLGSTNNIELEFSNLSYDERAILVNKSDIEDEKIIEYLTLKCLNNDIPANAFLNSNYKGKASLKNAMKACKEKKDYIL